MAYSYPGDGRSCSACGRFVRGEPLTAEDCLCGKCPPDALERYAARQVLETISNPAAATWQEVQAAPHCNLWAFTLGGPVEILPFPGGMTLAQQTHGCQCDQREVAGGLLPARFQNWNKNEWELWRELEKIWTCVPCCNPLPDLDRTDAILGWLFGVKLDRSRIDKSTEAWLHVLAKEGTLPVIVTWDNSD